MNRKRLLQVISMLLLTAAIAVLLFRLPQSKQGSVSITFLTMTNDSGGRRSALFLASNDTARLFVRGRSELELQEGPSNVVSVLQITNVDYLKPGATITFTVPSDDRTNPWRLNFHYIGQFDRHQEIVYETGWLLRRCGLFPESWISRLPHREEYKLTTEWVSRATNAQPSQD
jgi:hypothetical protein